MKGVATARKDVRRRSAGRDLGATIRWPETVCERSGEPTQPVSSPASDAVPNCALVVSAGERMSNKDLQLTSHNILPGKWWYEEVAGIHVVIEARDGQGRLIQTVSALIPWRSIKAALNRKVKP